MTQATFSRSHTLALLLQLLGGRFRKSGDVLRRTSVAFIHFFGYLRADRIFGHNSGHISLRWNSYFAVPSTMIAGLTAMLLNAQAPIEC